jgi:hypothetical protein
MVRANLHVICGNCGCNDEMSYKIEKDGHDFGDRMEDAVHIFCKNCCTLHDLSDTVKVDEPKEKVVDSE